MEKEREVKKTDKPYYQKGENNNQLNIPPSNSASMNIPVLNKLHHKYFANKERLKNAICFIPQPPISQGSDKISQDTNETYHTPICPPIENKIS